MGKSDFQIKVIMAIKRERESRGLGQKYIASLLGISMGHIGNIESPKASHKYTLRQIDTICKKFRIPAEQIFIPDDACLSGEKDCSSLLVSKIVEYEN